MDDDDVNGLSTMAALARLEKMTEAFAERTRVIESQASSDKERRHAMNNSLLRFLDTTQKEAAARDFGLNDRLREMSERMLAFEKWMTELDHVLRGVDKQNGIRGDVASVRAEINANRTAIQSLFLKFTVISTMLSSGVAVVVYFLKR